MRKKLGRLVGVIGMTTVLALSGSLKADAHSGTMNNKQARKLYITQLCRLDASIDHLNDAVFRGQKTVRVSEITPAWMSQINKALDTTGEHFHEVGAKVLFPHVAWPDPVVARANESAAYMDLVAYAMVSTENDEPRTFVRYWNGAVLPASKKWLKRVKAVMHRLNISDNVSCTNATGAVTTLRRVG